MECRSDLTELLNYKGNYQSRLSAKTITEESICEQLIQRFPIDNVNLTYQITYIYGPSFGDKGKLTSPLRPQRDKNSGLMSTLYYICKDGLDINKERIPSLGLTCCNVNTYFDGLFNDYVITTYTGPDNSKKVLRDSSAVLIFSNDLIEIADICNEIKNLSKNHSMPIIFIITDIKVSMDAEKINTDIADIISIAPIQSKENALAFWQSIKDRLEKLTYLTVKLMPEKEKNCVVM